MPGHFPSAQKWVLARKLHLCLLSDTPTGISPEYSLKRDVCAPNRLVLCLPKFRLSLAPEVSPRRLKERDPQWAEFNLSTFSPVPFLPSYPSGPTRQSFPMLQMH